MSRPVCVLVGPPGAGKSTVGRRVAAALEVTFHDTDSDVVASAGKPVAEIFVDDGEAVFRTLEKAAVASALLSCDGVLAVGGGAVLAKETRTLLRGHTVVYLDVGLADAVRRVGLGSGRPLVAVNPRATLKALLEQRRPIYEDVATVRVTTDGHSLDEVTRDVLAALSLIRGDR